MVLVNTSQSQLEQALQKSIQEKFKLQKRFEELEAHNTDISKSNEELSVKLQQIEEENRNLKEQLSSHNAMDENKLLTSRMAEMEKQLSISRTTISRLEESNRNAEECLQATEEMKRMLQREVESSMQVQRSLGANLEEAKSEVHSLKQEISKLKKELDSKTLQLQNYETNIAEQQRLLSEQNNLRDQMDYVAILEGQIANFKSRLEAAAEEYKALYLSTKKDNSLPTPKENVSEFRCPMCEAIVRKDDWQSHFEAHDSQQNSVAQMPKCPVCFKFFPAREIHGHVEQHFQ